jgi:transcription initiation factor IIF auxiliary subunit
MNRLEMFNLIDQLYAESDNAIDNIDESELSNELTSEGETTTNTVREAISDESMQNSPMAKSGNKLKRRS